MVITDQSHYYNCIYYFGIMMIFGILGGHTYGFENYTKGQAPFVGGISGILSVLLVAGFQLVVLK